MVRVVEKSAQDLSDHDETKNFVRLYPDLSEMYLDMQNISLSVPWHITASGKNGAEVILERWKCYKCQETFIGVGRSITAIAGEI